MGSAKTYEPHNVMTCDKPVCVEARRIIKEREHQLRLQARPERRRPSQLFGRPSPAYGRA